MTPNEASESNERLTDALHDCTYSISAVWYQCPMCREEYAENMHYWQNPHTSARAVWVCSDGCAHDWQEKHWESIPEFESKDGNLIPESELDFISIVADEIRKTLM